MTDYAKGRADGLEEAAQKLIWLFRDEPIFAVMEWRTVVAEIRALTATKSSDEKDIATVVAFDVRIECSACKGKQWVPGGQREYGEMVNCVPCEGLGTVPIQLPSNHFAKLVLALWEESKR